MKTGGGFGRRAVFDADVIVEAVATAKALGWSGPVKVQWTRENDMQGGRYRPAYVHAMKAGLDTDGNLVAWSNHIVGQSILNGTPFEGMTVKNGIDFTSVEGAANIPYAIPNLGVGLTTDRRACPCSGGGPSARRTPPMRSRPSSTKWRRRRARIRWNSGSRC